MNDRNEHYFKRQPGGWIKIEDLPYSIFDAYPNLGDWLRANDWVYLQDIELNLNAPAHDLESKFRIAGLLDDAIRYAQIAVSRRSLDEAVPASLSHWHGGGSYNADRVDAHNRITGSIDGAKNYGEWIATFEGRTLGKFIDRSGAEKAVERAEQSYVKDIKESLIELRREIQESLEYVEDNQPNNRQGLEALRAKLNERSATVHRSSPSERKIMGHYDECRPGYCGGCGAGPGNIRDGVCDFCGPKKAKKATAKTAPIAIGLDKVAWDRIMDAASRSPWIPHNHYTLDDITSDICRFLMEPRSEPKP